MRSTAEKTAEVPELGPASLERLYARHARFVRTFARQLLAGAADADDVTQEVFLLAWRKLRPAAEDTTRAWLCRTTMKLAASARRRAWLRARLGLQQRWEEADWNTPEHSAEADEALRAVDRILNTMSEKRRSVLVLFEFQGMSGQEIAAILGCPLKTVHTRLFHARREFLAKLGSDRDGSLLREPR